MAVNILSEGWVSKREPGPTVVACGPRLVLTDGGELLCTFMVQSKLGINDFQPHLARSTDGGRTWTEAAPIWPDIVDRFSIFGAISRGRGRTLHYFGTRYVIDTPGESLWNDATQGLKENVLFTCRSEDDGHSWSEPRVIPMPVPGAAEAPGPMCVTADGRLLVCYAPYNTFDPQVTVDRGQVALLASDDGGDTWEYQAMLRFAEPDSGGAEAWVIQLADGRLIGTSWHLNHADGTDYPNAYSVSSDQGRTWSPTASTGIQGQSTALTALPDGDVLFIYNQRKHEPHGIWCCHAAPTAADFGIRSRALLWQAPEVASEGGSADHNAWESFAFGEPAVAHVGDGVWLLVFWCDQTIGSGIRCVRFTREP